MCGRRLRPKGGGYRAPHRRGGFQAPPRGRVTRPGRVGGVSRPPPVRAASRVHAVELRGLGALHTPEGGGPREPAAKPFRPS